MKKIVFSLVTFLVASLSFAQNIPAYYSSIDFDLNGVPLKEQLAELITNTHTNQLSYTPGIWEALKNTDLDPEDNNKVLLLYGWANTTSGQHARTRAKNSNGGNSGQWNREHTYAKALGSPNLGTSGPGADAHHLRASDVQWNNSRGNSKFADGSGNSGPVSGGWYPGDEWKGDVARMMMYMYVRYGTQCLPANVGVGSTANTPDGMIDLFLEWNVEDPVSEVEIQRNDYLGGTGQYAQGNRNPFIDNPYLATKIWGGDPAEDTWGILNTKDFNLVEFNLYPNPAKNNTVYLSSKENIEQILIFTTDGKLIRKINNPVFIDETLQIDKLSSGLYLIKVKSNSKIASKKFIVE